MGGQPLGLLGALPYCCPRVRVREYIYYIVSYCV
nr:MAG TPA_asm: hypothetical protein [Caudoviricetes sp.]DAR60066.1 MAG TPA: hypothetical protein [Caudoviricetes sp.]